MCSEGIAAYRSGETWLTWADTPVTAPESVKPASSRGGATGSSQKTTRPRTFTSTRAVRARRYATGRQQYSHNSTASVTERCISW